MKSFASMLFCFFVSMLSSCVSHKLESPEKLTINTPPPGEGHWGKVSAKRDGHYNVALTETSSTCEPKDVVLADDWDIIDLGNGRMKIKFSNNGWSYWPEINIKARNGGQFSNTIATLPFPWLTGGYLAHKMEMSQGLLANNVLSAAITYSYLKGADKNVIPYCERKFQALGFRRFVSKRSVGKTTAGEYGAKLTVKKNTCGVAKELPQVFSLDVVPQEKGLYNLRMWSFLIADLGIAPDGTFKDMVMGDNSYLITDGLLTPDSIHFNLYIKYGLYACEQDLEIAGTKRFEESDGTDSVIDGVYGVTTILTMNTCDNRPPIARFHLDAISMDAGSMRLVLGNKDFSAALHGQNFSASYSGISSKNKFSGTITPQEFSGELAINVHEIDIINLMEKNCSFLYKVSGFKLYKHN